MTKRQRRTVGAILKIPLGDGSHTYAQTLPEADFVIFDAKSNRDLKPEEVVNKEVLFRVAVHNSAWTNSRWEKIGKANVQDEFMAPIPKFMQDMLNPNRFRIYLGGVIRSATREECSGLECCAVWDPEHVEDRIRDHYAGVPNKWFESLKIKHH